MSINQLQKQFLSIKFGMSSAHLGSESLDYAEQYNLNFPPCLLNSICTVARIMSNPDLFGALDHDEWDIKM